MTQSFQKSNKFQTLDEFCRNVNQSFHEIKPPSCPPLRSATPSIMITQDRINQPSANNRHLTAIVIKSNAEYYRRDAVPPRSHAAAPPRDLSWFSEQRNWDTDQPGHARHCYHLLLCSYAHSLVIKPAIIDHSPLLPADFSYVSLFDWLSKRLETSQSVFQLRRIFELELSQEMNINIERTISANIENLKKKMVKSIWQIYGCWTFYSILLRANQNRVKIHRITVPIKKIT